MVMLIYIGLLVVIILAIISHTVNAGSNIVNGLESHVRAANSPGGLIDLPTY